MGKREVRHVPPGLTRFPIPRGSHHGTNLKPSEKTLMTGTVELG
jgi:hypothetical protein